MRTPRLSKVKQFARDEAALYRAELELDLGPT